MKTILLSLAFLFSTTFSVYSQTESNPCDCENDNTNPVAGAYESSVLIECTEVDLSPYFPQFTDNCDSEVDVTTTVDTSYTETRVLQSLSSYGIVEVEWSIMLFDLEELGLRYFRLDSASITYDEENNSAHVYGRTISTSDSSAILDFDVYLTEASTWSEWSNFEYPTSYRDDSGLGEDLFEDWIYYLIDSNSTLTGHGSLEGTLLSLDHAPSSNYYAYQEGIAAHGYSPQNGSGGWFYFSGILEYNNESQEIFSVGDLAFNYQTCTQTTYDVQLTATDDCGNSTVVTQQFKTDLTSFDPENCACQIQGCTNPEASNYNPEASIQHGVCVGCPGDFDLNGEINTTDLLSFISFVGCESNCEGDLNHDGVVVSSDLLIMLSIFGLDCNPG